MFHKTLKTGLFRALVLALLKLLIIGINAEKMAPVLNHIVKNEGTQGSLYGILAYVESSMCFIKH